METTREIIEKGTYSGFDYIITKVVRDSGPLKYIKGQWEEIEIKKPEDHRHFVNLDGILRHKAKETSYNFKLHTNHDSDWNIVYGYDWCIYTIKYIIDRSISTKECRDKEAAKNKEKKMAESKERSVQVFNDFRNYLIKNGISIEVKKDGATVDYDSINILGVDFTLGKLKKRQ